MIRQLRQTREFRLFVGCGRPVERESRVVWALGIVNKRYFLVNLAPLSSFEKLLVLRVNELHVK
jgi:hypothetical protein